jgi:hypothetical protein
MSVIAMNELLFIYTLLDKNVEKFEELGMPNAVEQNLQTRTIIEKMITGGN